MSTISIDQLSEEITRTLQAYSDDVMAEVKKAEDETAKECIENLKADSPIGTTRKYAKGWKVIVAYENAIEKRTVIHNKEYRLTHLLENGHAKRAGGRTRAFPHIKKNEEKANAAFEQRVKEAIQNAGH